MPHKRAARLEGGTHRMRRRMRAGAALALSQHRHRSRPNVGPQVRSNDNALAHRTHMRAQQSRTAQHTCGCRQPRQPARGTAKPPTWHLGGAPPPPAVLHKLCKQRTPGRHRGPPSKPHTATAASPRKAPPEARECKRMHTASLRPTVCLHHPELARLPLHAELVVFLAPSLAC